jgi:hypothetical protein
MPTIPQLPSIVQLGSSDVFAVSANGVTYKCTGAQLTSALASIGAYITEDQLANNLTTTAEGLALDARQGKALSDALAVLGATVTGIGNAVSALGAKLADKADVIVDTASGAIASFPDGMAAPAKDITIGIEPVQSGSGDPSPTNVRPINGWTGANVTRTGKNLFNKDASDITKNSYINKYTGVTQPSSSGLYDASGYTKIPSSATLVLSGNDSNSMTEIAFYDAEKVFISGSGLNYYSGAFTTPSNAEYLRMTVKKTTYNALQLEIGSTATTYEPYSSTTIPISWQSEAGTVYGGTLDVTTGLLTVTHGNIASYSGESLPGRWISSMDVYSAGGTPTTGAQVVYELATPQTYQLTPTEVTLLLGYNNVWADTGDTTVTYRADTKLYIHKINAPTDDDMIADAQIASGKYFIIGGNLYKSTTTIPAGDAINPGSNCILTNLADALNALNT